MMTAKAIISVINIMLMYTESYISRIQYINRSLFYC